jgi:hypothetical protein
MLNKQAELWTLCEYIVKKKKNSGNLPTNAIVLRTTNKQKKIIDYFKYIERKRQRH